MRDQLQKCYRVEGVNSNEVCRHIAQKYAQMVEQNRVSQFLCVTENTSLSEVLRRFRDIKRLMYRIHIPDPTHFSPLNEVLCILQTTSRALGAALYP